MCWGNQTVSTQSKTMPEWLTSSAKDSVNYANSVREQGFTPYGNSTVAGFSPQQQASFGLGTDVASGAQPAIGNTGGWVNNYANAGPGSVNPSTIASRMSPYMSSYVQQALAPQLENQNQQFAAQNKGFDAQATGAGAYGDTGWGLGRSNLTQQQDTARTGLVGNAYNAAFNTAIGAGAQDVANDVNAQTTNANLRETALGRQLGAANTAFGMGTGATNLTNSLGGQQTAQSQAQLNAQYNEFLRQQYQDPQFRASLANSAIGAAVPASPSTTTTSAPDNSGFGMLGTALGTAGGFMLGGPAGAALGGMIGNKIGGYNADGSMSGNQWAAAGQGQGPYANGYYAAADGGDLPDDGSVALMGERGPEALVNDDGTVEMVGTGGPELRRARGGTVIPNEALQGGGLAAQLGATAPIPGEPALSYDPMFSPSSPGLAPAPPPTPPMTRALPDYESRDPAELAMIRHQEQVRPTAGRADIPPEHLAAVAREGALLGAGGIAGQFMGKVAAPVIAAARAAPKTTAVASGLTGAAVTGSEAGVETDRPAESFEVPLPEADPALTKRRDEIAAQMDRAEEAFQKRAAGKYPTAKAREIDAANHASKMDDFHKNIGDVEKEITGQQNKQKGEKQAELKAAADIQKAKEEREKPLIDKYPALMALPYLGGAFATGTAYVNRARAVEQYNTWASRVGDQIKKVSTQIEKVENAGKKKGVSPEALQREKDVLRGYVEEAPEMKALVKPGAIRAWAEKGTPAAAGAAIAGELSMVPAQIDLATREPDSAAGKEARKRLMTLEGWMKTGVSSVAGLTGSMIGSTLPTRTKPNWPDVKRAEVLGNAAPAAGATAAARTASPTGIPPGQLYPPAWMARQQQPLHSAP